MINAKPQGIITSTRSSILRERPCARRTDRYSVGNAQLLRRLMAAEISLSANEKIVIPSNTELVNFTGEMVGVLPFHNNGNGAAAEPEG